MTTTLNTFFDQENDDYEDDRSPKEIRRARLKQQIGIGLVVVSILGMMAAQKMDLFSKKKDKVLDIKKPKKEASYNKNHP